MTQRTLSLLVLPAALAFLAGATPFTLPAGAAGVAPAADWPQAASDLPADPDVRFGTLPNGMRYAIKHNAHPPGNASLRLRIEAGSLYEAEDQRGLAHFLEHMVLNGTRHVPEGQFFQRLERAGLKLGPDTNALTDFNFTEFKLDLPETDADTVETALFLLREVVGEATLDPAAIDAERGVILAEERMRATAAYRVTVDELGYLLKDQPLPERMPIGDLDVIRTAPRERLARFYDSYYRPERAVLIIVGDFDVEAMEGQVRAHFADWRGRGPAGPEPDRRPVADRELSARVFVEPGAAARTSLAFVQPPDLRRDRKAVRLAHVARELALQILNRRLERLASSASPAPFTVAVGVHSDLGRSAHVAEVLAIHEPSLWKEALTTIESAQRRLVQFGVTQAEIDREVGEATAALTSAAAGAATRTSAMEADLLFASVDARTVYTTPETNLALLTALKAEMTPARVTQSARDLFRGQGPLLYMNAPKAIDGGEAALLAAYSLAHAPAVTAEEARPALAWPYADFGPPGAVAGRRELDAVGATAVRFANGVGLLVKPTRLQDDQILVQVRAGGGRVAIPPDRPSPEWGISLGAVTEGGLADLTLDDMREVLAARVYGVSMDLADDAFVLNGATRPSDFALQMQVLAAFVAEPGWRPAGWDRVRGMSGTIRDSIAANPRAVFNSEGDALLHSGDRRWVVPTREEMAASSMADARDVLGPAFDHGPIEIVVVGDITVEEAIRQTAATFGALGRRDAAPAAAASVRFPAGTPQPIRLTHKGRPDQGLAVFAWPTTDRFAGGRQAGALDVLAEVLQLRLTAELREKRGVAYSPEAGNQASNALPGYGYVSGIVEAPPDLLGDILAAADRVADDLRERPVGDDELRRARQPLLEHLRRNRSSNAWWLSALGRADTDPRTAPGVADEVPGIEAVTPAAIQAAAQRFLRPDTAWKLVVTPERKG